MHDPRVRRGKTLGTSVAAATSTTGGAGAGAGTTRLAVRRRVKQPKSVFSVKAGSRPRACTRSGKTTVGVPGW